MIFGKIRISLADHRFCKPHNKTNTLRSLKKDVYFALEVVSILIGFNRPCCFFAHFTNKILVLFQPLLLHSVFSDERLLGLK